MLWTALLVTLLALTLSFSGCQTEQFASTVTPKIPKTCDEQALNSLEVPLPDLKFSPVAVLADYYHRVPVRSIYKSYEVYAPGKEPPGYLD